MEGDVAVIGAPNNDTDENGANSITDADATSDSASGGALDVANLDATATTAAATSSGWVSCSQCPAEASAHTPTTCSVCQRSR